MHHVTVEDMKFKKKENNLKVLHYKEISAVFKTNPTAIPEKQNPDSI